MVNKYIKNIDSVDHTYSGQLIVAGTYHLIDIEDSNKFIKNSQLISDITAGFIRMAKSDDGENDIIDIAQQILFLVGTQTEISNVPTVKTQKPSGYSQTIITHNFCDENTWPSTNDSTWELSPPQGYKYVVIKAEVQFSHDVALGSQSTPGEMYLDFWAGGAKIDSESKVFKSIQDVFNYGNRHYTMTPSVDGVPGMTTVEFDYADEIVLESSMLKKMVFSLKNNLKMDGTFCTVSFVVRPEQE